MRLKFGKFLSRRSLSVMMLTGVVLTVLPTGLLWAQSKLYVNTQNTANVDAHAFFMKALQVDVSSRITVVKIPEIISNQIFIQVRGGAKNDALVVNCSIQNDDVATRQTACDGGVTDKSQLVMNGTVFYKRIKLDYVRQTGGKNVAIDFTYL